jgi:hypothetical protein
VDVDDGDVGAASGQQLERVGRARRHADTQIVARGVDAGVGRVRHEVERHGGRRRRLARAVAAAVAAAHERRDERHRCQDGPAHARQG